jgi:hypothetical protein
VLWSQVVRTSEDEMRKVSLLIGLGSAVTAAVVMAACGGDDSVSGTPDSGAGLDGSKSGKDTGTGNNDAGDMDSSSLDAPMGPDVSSIASHVYAHSPDTLYLFDIATQSMTLINKFSGCAQGTNLTQVIDLALDSSSNAYVTTFDGLYSVDLSTAVCTLIKAGTGYPNSLAFVPRGTLDPSNEVLVGYVGANYVKIDTTTGTITGVGGLSTGYASSGDIVSVQDGGTFLTVTGNGCGDCMLQVNPVTGGVVQNYGAVGHTHSYGMGYWAGVAYGFDESGEVFAITGGDGGLADTTLIIGADAGYKFWGAGNTTLAPALAPDGGSISIK